MADSAKRPKEALHPSPNLITAVIDDTIGVVEVATRSIPYVKWPRDFERINFVAIFFHKRKGRYSSGGGIIGTVVGKTRG